MTNREGSRSTPTKAARRLRCTASSNEAHQSSRGLQPRRGACRNWAEEFCSHMRLAEIGHHHHIAGAYLRPTPKRRHGVRITARVSNGEQVGRIARLAVKARKSVDFTAIGRDTGTSCLGWRHGRRGFFALAARMRLLPGWLAKSQLREAGGVYLARWHRSVFGFRYAAGLVARRLYLRSRRHPLASPLPLALSRIFF
jgi:hypothetical protein